MKDGVIDVTEIKKELILNGFTKVPASPNSNTNTSAYNYDKMEEELEEFMKAIEEASEKTILVNHWK